MAPVAHLYEVKGAISFLLSYIGQYEVNGVISCLHSVVKLSKSYRIGLFILVIFSIPCVVEVESM